MPPGGNSPAKETSKQRSLRIELLYLRRGNAWYRSKYAWSLLALLIAGAYVVWLGVGGEPAAAQLSPGPLASPHAALNTRCADCHTEYVSTSAGGEGVNWLSSKLLGADVELRTEVGDLKNIHIHAGDVKCIVCHQREAQDHHKNQFPHDLQSCGSCHADHQGHGMSLVRPDDSACTRCHQEIDLHRKDKKSEYDPPIGPVAFFDKGGAPQPNHPKFRSVPTTDDNNFKFNHQLHMLPGQWARGGDPKDAFGPKKLLAGFEGKYGAVDVPADPAKPDSPEPKVTLVQLECKSCHVPQTGDPTAQSGAYMLPIVYEQHCKACHPLDLGLIEIKDQQAAPAPENKQLLMPHGLNKREIDEFVVGVSAKLTGSGELPARFPDPVPVRIPGKTPSENSKTGAPNDPENAERERKRLGEWQSRIQDVLCGKCHDTDVQPPPGSSADLFKQAVGFAPPKIPQRWLKHGQFDHRAHAAWAKCVDCHKDTEAPQTLMKKPLHDDDKVLIPQIEKCVECHAPANPHDNNKSWARFDCAECHRYHHSPGAP